MTGKLLYGLIALTLLLMGTTNVNGSGINSIPVKVDIYIEIISIDHIEMEDGTFRANFYMITNWTHPENAKALAPGETEIEFGNKDLVDKVFFDGFWTPEIEFINAQEYPKNIKSYLRIGNNGEATLLQRFVGIFKTDFQFERYPFDFQDFNIDLESFSFGIDQVELVSGKNFNGLSIRNLSSMTWEMKGLSCMPKITQSIELGRSGNLITTEYRRLSFVVRARRKSGYFIWNILFPFTLLMFSTILALGLKKDRAGIIYSLLLLMVMFQFSIGLNIPDVPYFTIMDIVIMTGYIVVFLSVVYITRPQFFRKSRVDRVTKA